MRSRSNSRSSRSWMISMWSMPRKPQRKPKPRAAEDSGSKDREASLSWSFSRASRDLDTWSRPRCKCRSTPWRGRAVAGQGLGGGALHTGDGVTHLGILHVFDGGSEVAHLAGDQLAAGLHPQGEQVAALQHLIGRARGHHLHLHPGLDGTLHHTEIDDHAPVGVVLAVKDQGAERGLRVALGGGTFFTMSSSTASMFSPTLAEISGRPGRAGR